jgi:glycogen synthase
VIRLLIYSHFFPPSIGGVETIVASLARGLAELRTGQGSPQFEITLVTQTPAGDFQDAALPFGVVRRPTGWQFWQLVRGADVLHVAGAAITPILCGKLAGKPVVVEHHAFQTICPTGQLFQEPENVPCSGHFMAGRHTNCLRCRADNNRWASFRLWLLAFVRRWLCNRVAVNIAPTAWLNALLRLAHTEVIPHGLEPAAPVVSLHGSNSVPILVFIGRLVTTKGVTVLLEAAQILSREGHPFQLLIAGDGPGRASREVLAHERQLDERVRFLGAIDEHQIRETLEKADLVIVPSLAGEVFGLVVAENMLRGLPVVASDLGSFAEVLGNTGRTFATGNSMDLARQIMSLLADAPARRNLGMAARQRVLDFFNLRRMIDEHARVYLRGATPNDN